MQHDNCAAVQMVKLCKLNHFQIRDKVSAAVVRPNGQNDQLTVGKASSPGYSCGKATLGIPRTSNIIASLTWSGYSLV